MPINEIVPSLHQFLQIASTSEDNKTIRSTNEGLSSTGLPTWASTNQKTMSDFISALKAEFGSQIANAASARLATLTESGNKPLKAFMIRQTVDEALSTTQANLNIRDKFLSGIDPNHSFEAKFAEILQDPRNFSLPLDEESKAVFKEAFLSDIKDYTLHTSNRLSTEDLERRLSALPSVHAARQLFTDGTALSVLQGSPNDKMKIAHMLDYNNALCTVAMQKLPLCRMLQPEGVLTRSTVWQAVTGSPMPEEAENLSDFSFCESIENAFSEKLEQTLKNKDNTDRVMSCLGNVKLESAIDIAKTGRPLTKDDFISACSSLLPCARSAKNNQAERTIAKDICRMGNVNKNGQPAFAGVNFHTADGTVKMPFGKAAKDTFPFRDEADKTAFASGSPSSFTQQLRNNCRTICEGRENQAEALLSLFSQSPLRAFAAMGGTSNIGTLIPSELNEHMAAIYDVSRQPDGSIRMEINSNEASERAGRSTMTVIVGQDGALAVESCKMESAANVMEQNLRGMVSELVTAPTLSADSKTILSKMAGDILVNNGLHLQNPGIWKDAIEPMLAEFQANSAIMESLRAMPRQIDPQTAQTICSELENNISTYYRQTYNQMNENGIFPIYIIDALRHSIDSINGKALRFIPASHTGPVPLNPGTEIPDTKIQEDGVQEQLIEAIPNKKLRGFVSQVACQAGLENVLCLNLAGTDPEHQTPPWQNYINLMELMSKSTGPINYSYPKHKYTINTDELVPERPLSDPINEGRGIHIQLEITQGVEGMLDEKKFKGELMNFTVRMDIPFNQPPREEGEPPVFRISVLEGRPA